MAMTNTEKIMMEHANRYRIYQQKVQEFERLQKQIEEETGEKWQDVRKDVEPEEQYGPIVAMLIRRLKKLEYPAKEAAYWLQLMESALEALPEKARNMVKSSLQGKYAQEVAQELYTSESSVKRAKASLYRMMVELSGDEETGVGG